MRQADADDEEHDRDLEDHDQVVDPGRFLDPDDQDRAHHGDDEDGGEVDQRAGHVQAGVGASGHHVDLRVRAPLGRRVGQVGGEVDAELLEQADQVAGPADAHRGGAGGVLEDEIPADDPGHQLTHGCVGVGVGAAGHRHGAGHLGVAQAGERAGDPDQDHRDPHCRPGMQRRRLAGEHEDPRADDGADAERDEVQGAQGPLQRVLADMIGLGTQYGNRLRGPQTH